MNEEKVIEERSESYGTAYDDFNCVGAMFEAWQLKRSLSRNLGQLDKPLERCLRHVVYMILVKLSRMAETPLYRDNIVDIIGYARRLIDCYEVEEK